MTEENQSALVDYFATTNKQLAEAWFNDGGAFAPQPAGPCQNFYTAEFLRGRGIGIGQPLETAARLAVQQKTPGKVIYYLVRGEHLSRFLKAWDSADQEQVDAASAGRPPAVPEISTEIVAQVLHARSVNAKLFAEFPWYNEAIIASPQTSREKDTPINGKPAGVQHYRGSLRMRSLTASAATKRKVGF